MASFLFEGALHHHSIAKRGNLTYGSREFSSCAVYARSLLFSVLSIVKIWVEGEELHVDERLMRKKKKKKGRGGRGEIKSKAFGAL